MIRNCFTDHTRLEVYSFRFTTVSTDYCRSLKNRSDHVNAVPLYWADHDNVLLWKIIWSYNFHIPCSYPIHYSNIPFTIDIPIIYQSVSHGLPWILGFSPINLHHQLFPGTNGIGYTGTGRYLVTIWVSRLILEPFRLDRARTKHLIGKNSTSWLKMIHETPKTGRISHVHADFLTKALEHILMMFDEAQTWSLTILTHVAAANDPQPIC